MTITRRRGVAARSKRHRGIACCLAYDPFSARSRPSRSSLKRDRQASQQRGRPRHRPRRPRRLFADRSYDFDKYRRLVRARGMTPKVARRGTPHGSGLGKIRWVVERTFAWLHQFKRLRVRYEMRAGLQLACSIICLRRGGWSGDRSEVNGYCPDSPGAAENDRGRAVRR
ncbi:transposase [Streptomyces sp. NPDC006173]|uniref:transposase n=1 Tax=Streptomyces sp. NPDC006173 TaxID=3155349 RepID=UPI0033CAE424